MKKILIVLLIYYNCLNASDNYELKLYEKVLPSIFTKLPIKVFVDKKHRKMLQNSSKFKVVDNCNESVVLLVGKDFTKLPSECKNKPLFSTSYRSFKNDKNSFGAFYWRKGRPQIKFKNDVLDRYNLNLPASLKKYAK